MRAVVFIIGTLAVCLAGAVHAQPTGPGLFIPVTPSPLDDAGECTSHAWGDYDSDGDLDLYLSNINGANTLLRNDGASGFTDVTSGPLGDVSGGQSTVWVDYDGDSDLDLFLVNESSSNLMFRNDGGDVFTDATSPVLAGVFGVTDVFSWGQSWADYDSDGDLDLYVSYNTASTVVPAFNTLLQNDGSGNFIEVTQQVGLVSPLPGAGCAWADYDKDGDPDLYLCNAGGPNSLYRNDGGFFTDIASPAPFPAQTGYPGPSYGVTWADFDNDEDLDLFVANFFNANLMFRNDDGVSFSTVQSAELADEGSGFTGIWGDYDNDGDLDCYMVDHIDPNQLLQNDGGGVFSDVTDFVISQASIICADASWVDVNSDGFLDIYISNASGANALLTNAGNSNHWLRIKLVGTVSNAAAIGAKVRIQSAGSAQFREVSGGDGFLTQAPYDVHFGLGASDSVESLEITWPSGIVQTLSDVAADQIITVIEEEPVLFVRGDVNEDNLIDISDAIASLEALFSSGSISCDKSADMNDDGGFDIADSIYFLAYLFSGGPPMPAPAGPECGEDLTEDDLTCGSYSSCQ